MRQFNAAVACVSLAILAAACSDTAAVPSSPLSPSAASFAGNPPPPPLTGDGGDLFFDPFPDEETFAATHTAPTTGACEFLSGVGDTFSWSYLNNKTDNNQWTHLNLDGQNRNINIHQTGNKLDATGEIVGPNYVFRITNVESGSLTPSGFDLTVDGVVTLSNGTKCTLTGADLSGSFFPSN